MCAVSFISDAYMNRYPLPNFAPTPSLEEYLELVRKAAEYDKLTGQPDCPKPGAEAFRQQVEKIVNERLAQLEKEKK